MISNYYDWPFVSFGEYVKNVARKRGLNYKSREVLQSIGESLIKENLNAFCIATLEQGNWVPGKPLIIEGIRHKKVVKILRELVLPSPFYLIYIDIGKEAQMERVKEKEHDLLLKKEALMTNHSTEIEVISILRELADFIVDGNLSKDNVIKAIVSWINDKL